MTACRVHGSVISALVAASTIQAAGPPPMLPVTTAPFTYVINYSGDYFTKPNYIERFEDAPPDLLHVGKATPITHLWGPVRMYQGENQYTGGPGHTLNWDNVALLSPQALEERIRVIRETLRRYHALGIREITPYVSYHTLAGDHEKRLGFWKFYDNWAEYLKRAGPRPEHDPFDWLVVDVEGKFVGGSCGGYSPDYFAPLHRYRACINHPDWCEWHRRLIRMIAEVGYDGCFVDNTHADACYCRYCKAVFRKFLNENRDLYWVRRLTNGLDVDKLQLDSPDVPAELVRRARMLRTGDHLGMLREVGRQVKPGFTIFPNGNSTAECLVTGGQCDRLMFESTYSPGILAADDTPVTSRVAVVVSAHPVESKRFTHRCELYDGQAWVELKADVSLPTSAQVDRPARFEVKVINVGSSAEDGDFAEDFHLLLEDAERGEKVRVDLEPAGFVGGSIRRAGKPGNETQPPVTLQGTWTPGRTGTYAVSLALRYTDESHLRDTDRRLYVQKLDRGRVCRTHVGTLMFAQHMTARTIFLGYESRRKGWENVEQLGLAELAAFSGGGAFAAHSATQAKYGAFFKKHTDLYAGWQPTAPAAVLFAYWGSNPLAHVRPVKRLTIHDHLAGAQRPFVALVDTRLPLQPESLAAFQVIYLQAREYDMSQAQLDALRDYVKRGGCLVVGDEQITINGQRAAAMFGVSGAQSARNHGAGRVVLWNWDDPTTLTQPVAPGSGRQKHVRFVLYRKENRLALHAVNYNVCLLDAAKRVLDVDDVELRIPVPGDWQAVRATSFEPGHESQPLDCTVAEGIAQLTLPKLHVYKIVLLEKK